MTRDRSFRTATFVIVVGVLATTLAQTGVLAALPLRNLLKNELHLDRTASAEFFFWAGLAWYVKPIFGIVTDAFPLFGTRRQSYMLIGAVFGTLGWIVLTFTPHEAYAMLAVVIGINVFMAIASTVTGGFMVEVAQSSEASGRLTAVRQFVMQACGIVTSPIAGFLASIAFAWTTGASAAIMFLLVPVTIWFLNEPRHPPQPLGVVRDQFRNIVNARAMWGAAGLMLLYYAAPGFGTAMFYKQQNQLHMTTEMQGWLGLAVSIIGVGTAVLYGWACERLNLRTLLFAAIGLSTATTVLYIYYASIPLAFTIDTINAFGGTLAELALMDLAVRATPAGSEGLGFSLMVSVRNLALFGTDVLGSKLLDGYHWHFDWLVFANAGTTALALPFIFLLPAALVRRHDA